MADPSPELTAALADGEVTRAEIERAFEAYVSCLVAGGGSGEIAYDLQRGPEFALQIGVEGDGPNGNLTDRLMAFCDQRHIRGMDSLYAVEFSAREREQRGFEMMGECLDDNSIDLAGETLRDLEDALNRMIIDPGVTVDQRQAAMECSNSGVYGGWRPFG